MTFNDNDEITGPNTYIRINGVWILAAGSGAETMTDAMVRYLLTMNVPDVRTAVSKTTRETTSKTKDKPYYIYKEA